MTQILKNLVLVFVILILSIFNHKILAIDLDLDLNTKSDELNTDFSQINPEDVIKWDLITSILYKNNILELVVNLSSSDFSLYKNNLQFNPSITSSLERINYPDSKTIIDPLTTKNVEVFNSGNFEIILNVTDAFTTNADNFLEITFIGCTSKICLLPHTTRLKLQIIKSNEEFLEANKAFRIISKSLKNTPHTTSKKTSSIDKTNKTPNTINNPKISNTSSSWDHLLALQFKSENTSFLWILIICFLGGLLTNLTPCVYPMIPITIRVLSKQNNSFLNPLIYGLGICIIYALIGIIAAMSGTLLGSLVSSKAFNLIFGIFIFFMAITMIGYGNFSLLQKIGSKMGTANKSYFQTLIMGMAAGFVAAPCTGPVLAGLMAYSITNLSTSGSTLLFVLYSIGFAIPYVFFGKLIIKFSSIKVPYYIQSLIKYAMAAVLMGLSLYYLRIPFYQYIKQIPQNLWFMLMISFIFLGSIMLLSVTFIKTINKRSFAIAPILALGIGLFSSAQYVQYKSKSSLIWQQDTNKIQKLFESQKKPVLIALWAEWCTTCKVMESTTFSDPKVINYIKSNNITLVKYDLTQITASSQSIFDMYNVKGLPAYVIIGGYDHNLKTKKQFNTLHGLYDADNFLASMDNYLKNYQSNVIN